MQKFRLTESKNSNGTNVVSIIPELLIEIKIDEKNVPHELFIYLFLKTVNVHF